MFIQKINLRLALLTGIVFCTAGNALADQNNPAEPAAPDRSRNLVDSQDAYYNAVQWLQDTDGDVVRAREDAMKVALSTPEYAAAVKLVEQTYQSYADKKNAVVGELEKKNPVYSQMKSQSIATDAQIDAARQNPNTSQEQLDDLYKNRDTFRHQWQQLESDALDRAGVTPIHQAWIDASKKLSDLRDKQRSDVESSDNVKRAIALATAARASVDDARLAIGPSTQLDPANSEQVNAGDLLCKTSRPGIAGNDAWWTYGWTGVGSVKPAAGK